MWKFPFCGWILVAPVVLGACDVASAAEQAGLEAEGRRMAEARCARCHAVGMSGDSAHPSAPPFRTIGLRYPIESLAEAFAEGITTGHPDMPEFILEPGEIGALLAYLKSLQGGER